MHKSVLLVKNDKKVPFIFESRKNTHFRFFLTSWELSREFNLTWSEKVQFVKNGRFGQNLKCHGSVTDQPNTTKYTFLNFLKILKIKKRI